MRAGFARAEVAYYTGDMHAAPGARGRVLHSPTAARVANSRLSDFARYLERATGRTFDDYASLHAWSIREPERFWEAIWNHFEIDAEQPYEHVFTPSTSTGCFSGRQWFSGAKLNYAKHALRGSAHRPAIIYRHESGAREQLSYGELMRRVGRARAGLKALGVGVGDRVAGYLPNGPEAVVGLLASASLGAIWSSCPPEFGSSSVVDRLSIIEPKVLLAVRGYSYGGKVVDRSEDLQRIVQSLPSLRAVVAVTRPELGEDAQRVSDDWGNGALRWLSFEQLCEREAPLQFESVPFDHPLWILYSSGSTGKPKAIVHGHGGILLEHFKALALHGDLGESSRFFWFSTTGWMMWNYLVGGLLLGATIVLYDGSPSVSGLNTLWRLADEERVTYFGTSAPFIMSCRARGLSPKQSVSLEALQVIGSTGAPLPPEGFEWVYAHVRNDVELSSISGGTDLCTAFVLSAPWLPVRAGELSCLALGADVAAFDEQGQALIDEVGELVLRQSMPSMPLALWGDTAAERYRASYFERFDGVWCHGDWIRIFADGAAVIYGRSDATLNRGGVRMGTSEFYRALETVEEVTDSLVVDTGMLGAPGKLWLFVTTQDGELSDELRRRIKARLRQGLSPRHVPDVICLVAEIPYTLSGKKVEVVVRRALQGRALTDVAQLGSLKNPQSLEALLETARAAS